MLYLFFPQEVAQSTRHLGKQLKSREVKTCNNNNRQLPSLTLAELAGIRTCAAVFDSLLPLKETVAEKLTSRSRLVPQERIQLPGFSSLGHRPQNSQKWKKDGRRAEGYL